MGGLEGQKHYICIGGRNIQCESLVGVVWKDNTTAYLWMGGETIPIHMYGWVGVIIPHKCVGGREENYFCACKGGWDWKKTTACVWIVGR